MKDNEPESVPSHRDLFYRNELYPRPEAVFSFFPRLPGEIKNTCLVVVDTSALLVPYETGKKTLAEVQKEFRVLVDAKRLVIPGQVAREFADGRATKLREVYQKLASKRQNSPSLELGTYPLLETCEPYQAARSRAAEVAAAHEGLTGAVKEFNAALETLLKHIREWYWNDPVSQMYRELFVNDVVLDVSSSHADIEADLLRRRKYKIPPGYKDFRKPDLGVGDLIIWRTILEVGKRQQRDVIFVTEDEKADWAYRSNKEKLYGRYELVDEFAQHSDGRSFHVMSLGEYLSLVGADSGVIEELRLVETSHSRISLTGGSIVIDGTVNPSVRVHVSGDDFFLRFGDPEYLAAFRPARLNLNTATNPSNQGLGSCTFRGTPTMFFIASLDLGNERVEGTITGYARFQEFTPPPEPLFSVEFGGRVAVTDNALGRTYNIVA